MTPEQREERLAELGHETSREWLRFAVTEAIVLWLPFAVFLAIYVTTDAIPDTALVPVAVAGIAISTCLVLYWVLTRIRPLQREREQIVAFDGS